MTRYVLGIDAGASKTVAILADEAGRVCARARGRGANLNVQGEPAVESALVDLLGEVLGSPGVPQELSISAVCVGTAGADRPEEQRRLLDILRRSGLVAPVRVVHDASIALVAGTVATEEALASPGRSIPPGIVVIAGTGSMAYGVGRSGETARAGGWGYVLADEGSAFWLGQELLRASLRALDGRGPATGLREGVENALGVTLPDELVRWTYGSAELQQRVAALLPVLQSSLLERDAVAESIACTAAQHLVASVVAVRGRLDLPDGFPVLLAGGAFRGCPSLAALVVQRVGANEALAGAAPRVLDQEPALGAVRLALDAMARD